MTWAIPWSPGSLPLWPRVPVTALKPLQAPLSSSPGPSSMGRLAPCLHPFWVRGPLLGCLRAPGTLGSPLVISTLPPTPPLSQEHPQGCPLPGSYRAFHFQLLPLKRSDHPSIPTPSLGCPESLHICIRHSILVHFQSLLPSLEAAKQSPRPGTSYSGKTSPRSFQTRIWMAALELNRQTVCT